MTSKNHNDQVNPTQENSSSLVYLARQPIFNADQTVNAYELLYRSTEQNAFQPDAVSDEEATGTVISESILNFGIDEITNGKKAFINFADGFLLTQAAYLLEPKKFTIEILESVVFTIEVIDALYTLKAAGFDIALDDYVGVNLSPDILDLIDIIKIDFLLTTKEQRAAFVPDLLRAGKILLAEKVETKEDVEEAKALGCQLFQGYYYSKPVMMKKNRMDIASSSYVKLSKEISQPTINIDRVAYIINWDAHLTYKLLKKVKTLRYYRGNIINSIKQALVMMGEAEVRRWMMLVFIRGVLDSRSDERIRTGLIRAFMCEKLAEETGNTKHISPAFCTGIFSILLFDSVSPDEAFGDVQIPTMIKSALAGEDNILRNFLDLTFCYEDGDWDGLNRLLEKTGLNLEQRHLTKLYLRSVSSADEMLAKDNYWGMY